MNALQRLFNIYPEEARKALLFAGLTFVAALAIICGSKLADALLILHVGAQAIPTAYVAISLGGIAISSILIRIYQRFSAYHIFLSVILVAAAFYSLALGCLYAGIGVDKDILFYVLKVGGYILFINFLTSLWSFIDRYYHLQDAKRLFAFFSSAIFLAMAVTGAVLQLDLFNTHTLYILILVLLAITAAVMTYISKTISPVVTDAVYEGSQNRMSLMDFVKAVLSSRIAVLVLSLDLVIQMLLWITEYNYMSDFQGRFGVTTPLDGHETSALLTRFLGNWVAIVGILNIVLGLFVYSRLVRWFGVNNLEVISPILFTAIFLAWPFSHSLLVPLLGYFAVDGINFVIDDTNFNLLLNAIPNKIKYRFRIIVEFFFEALGMLLATPILSMFGVNSRWVGLSLAGVALALALGIRANYVKGIFANLSENVLHFNRRIADWWRRMPERERRDSKHKLTRMLQHGTPNEQLLACQALMAYGDNALVQRIVPLIGNVSASVKIKFVELLDTSGVAADAILLDLLEGWLRDDNDEKMRSHVLFYLAKHGLLHPEKIRHELHNEDLLRRGTAILALQTGWTPSPLTDGARNTSRVAEEIDALLNSESTDEICMGITILSVEGAPQSVDVLIPFLKHESPSVVRGAVQAIARLIERNKAEKRWLRYVSVIAQLLTSSSDKDTRHFCLLALGNIGDSASVPHIIAASARFRPSERRRAEKVILAMGLRTVPALLRLIEDKSLHPRCRILAGRILGKLAPEQLRTHIYRIINEEIERAYFYFYHSHRIQRQHPEYDLRMLEDALATSYHSVMDFIIQMLGVAGALEDAEILSWALHSPNKKIASQAIETIEKTCDPETFLLLEPLIAGDLPLEEKLHCYLLGGRLPHTLTELLTALEQSPIHIDNIMAATLKRRFNFAQWRESLRKQMTSNHEVFYRCAYELLES